MTRARHSAGFSLVEVIVAGMVLVVLLSLLAGFLAQQQDLSARTQARNEVQDKARVAMQIVVQDLQLSGAKYFVDGAGDIVDSVSLGTCSVVSSRATCFAADDDGLADDFGAVYVTTTRDTTLTSGRAEACRRVFYALEGTNLLRADSSTVCAAPETVDPESSDANTAFDAVAQNLLATNIEAFNIVYRCSNGVWVDSFPNASCPPGTSYLRSAVVSIYAASDAPYPGAVGDGFEVVVVDSTSGGAATTTQTVACPADRVCLGLTQEVLLPNLKQ